MSPRVSTSQPLVATPSQLAKPAAQEATAQRPAAQAIVALAPTQRTPHAPHWLTSVAVATSQPLVHEPSQLVKPALQVRAQKPALHPPVALAAAGHTLLQKPQWRASPRRSTSQPLAALPSQSPKPASQVTPHAPAAQVAVPFARAGHGVLVVVFPSALQTSRTVPAQVTAPGVHRQAPQRPAVQLAPDGHVVVVYPRPSALQRLAIEDDRQVPVPGVHVQARQVPALHDSRAAHAVNDCVRPSALHVRRIVSDAQSRAPGVHA
jgi:hypothetical protein